MRCEWMNIGLEPCVSGAKRNPRTISNSRRANFKRLALWTGTFGNFRCKSTFRQAKACKRGRCWGRLIVPSCRSPRSRYPARTPDTARLSGSLSGSVVWLGCLARLSGSVVWIVVWIEERPSRNLICSTSLPLLPQSLGQVRRECRMRHDSEHYAIGHIRFRSAQGLRWISRQDESPKPFCCPVAGFRPGH